MYRVLKEDTLVQALNDLSNKKGGVLEKPSIQLGTDARVLIVSIGGMGSRTLIRLKQELTKKVGQINDREMRFLAVDTAYTELRGARDNGELASNEVCELVTNVQMNGTITPDSEFAPMSLRKIVPEEGFAPDIQGNGAGQNRLAGRMAAINDQNREKLTKQIEGIINQFGSFVRHNFAVYIIGGLGGGTGSGLCIDIPYLIRQAAIQKNIPDDKIKIYGNFYLPNAYSDNSRRAVFNHNGYAALKEIDHYMNIRELGGEYRLCLDANQELVSKSNIFDLCTLIGGTSYLAINFPDVTTNAIEVCVQNLMNRVTQAWTRVKIDGTETKTSVDVFTEHAHQINVPANLNKLIEAHQTGNSRLTGNASYKYSCVGVSSITFPSDAIIDTYLGTVFCDKVFGTWKNNADVLRNDPKDAFAEFAKPTSPEALVDSMMRKFEAEYDQDANISQLSRDVNSKSDFIKWCRTLVEKYEGQFTGTYIDAEIRSAKGKIKSKADEIFADAARGPLYLEEILYNEYYGYFNTASRYYTFCAELAESHRKALGCHEQALNTTTRFSSGRRGNQEKEQFLAKAKDYSCESLREKLYDKLAKTGYKDSYSPEKPFSDIIREELENRFVQKIDIIYYLNDILKQNKENSACYLSAADTPDESSILKMDDASLKPLRTKLSQTIKECNSAASFSDVARNQFMARFAQLTLAKENEWEIEAGHPENSKCVELFRTFIKNYNEPNFRKMIDGTFASYMDEAYATADPKTKDDAAEAISVKLSESAAPMFNTWNGTELNDFKSVLFQFIMVPSNMSQFWKDRFGTLLGTSERDKVFAGSDSSTIYRYTSYARLPLWLHKDLADYEESYNKYYNTIGLHIDESKENNFRRLPSLFIPEQRYRYTLKHNTEYVDSNEDQYREELKKQIARAEAYGILSQDANEKFSIRYTDKGKVENGLNDFIKEYASGHYDPRTKTFTLGDAFYIEFVKTFSNAPKPIGSYKIGPQPYEANDHSKLVSMLRRKVHTAKALKNELDYVDNILTQAKEKLEKEKERRIKEENLEKFAQYLGYGFISVDENGIWHCNGYKDDNNVICIDPNVQIELISTALVSTRYTYQYNVNFMELPVFDFFFRRVDGSSLEAAYTAEIDRIIAKPAEARKEFRDQCHSYIDRFEKILYDIYARAQQSRSEAYDETIKKFYDALQQKFKDKFGYLL